MAAARPQVSVFSGQTGKATEQATLPEVFLTPIRPDIVSFVYTNVAKNKRQPYAVSKTAGEQTSAESWGTGRAVARIPRVSGGGTHRAGQGAFGNVCFFLFLFFLLSVSFFFSFFFFFLSVSCCAMCMFFDFSLFFSSSLCYPCCNLKTKQLFTDVSWWTYVRPYQGLAQVVSQDQLEPTSYCRLLCFGCLCPSRFGYGPWSPC